MRAFTAQERHEAASRLTVAWLENQIVHEFDEKKNEGDCHCGVEASVGALIRRCNQEVDVGAPQGKHSRERHDHLER
jgi:hypothetical protein